MPKAIDLTGQTFGELFVLEKTESKFIGKKKRTAKSTWKCRCSCGKEISVLATNLRHKGKGTKSCGCKFLKSKKYNFNDLAGKKFGYLAVIERSIKFTKTRGAIWICKCECGESCEVPTNSLTSGNKITCGNKKNHMNNSLDPRVLRCGEIPLSHINNTKQNAIKRNLLFTVSPEYLWDLFIKQNKICVLSGLPLQFTPHRAATSTRRDFTNASLDRIDSSVGYIEGNVRWVHKALNIMRMSLTDKDFLEYCRLCFLNQYSVGKNNRPTFDEYFLNIAFDVSLRSDDNNIRHGAVIVTNQNHIIGTGYNATIRNSDKNKIPYNIREKKRLWMIHAEENAILNSRENPLTIGGAKIYITGLPCVNCLQRIINFGITEVIYADRIGSVTENEETMKMRKDIIKMSKIKVRKMKLDSFWLKRTILS
jgi:deoxycytidylate deaminase